MIHLLQRFNLVWVVLLFVDQPIGYQWFTIINQSTHKLCNVLFGKSVAIETLYYFASQLDV